MTDKESEPTKWKNYDSILQGRGEADICFPSDFYFLKHAYQSINGRKQRAEVMK